MKIFRSNVLIDFEIVQVNAQVEKQVQKDFLKMMGKSAENKRLLGPKN